MIADLLGRVPVHSQAELGQLLTAEGVAVTQATLSRDLEELQATKVRLSHGQQVYAVPVDGALRLPSVADLARLGRLLAELLVTADAAGSLVVIRSAPGGAGLLGLELDRARLPGVLGTVAGDDTVLVICRTERRARRLVDTLLDTAEGRTSAKPGS